MFYIKHEPATEVIGESEFWYIERTGTVERWGVFHDHKRAEMVCTLLNQHPDEYYTEELPTEFMDLMRRVIIDDQFIRSWAFKTNLEFYGKTPIQMWRENPKIVEDMVCRFEHGVFS